MQPTRSYSLRAKPAPGEHTPVVDKQRPYMSISLDDPPMALNGRLRFAAGADGASGPNDRANDADDTSDEDDLAAETNSPLVVCRHLALKYCECSILDPSFHPSELFTCRPITQEDPARLDRLDQCTTRFASHVHLLPARLFGQFLTQAFEEIHEDLLQQATPAPGEAAQCWRVYYATTVHHAMGLRLRLKIGADQSLEFVVNVYDPNTSPRQVTCRCERAQDFAEHAEDYGFLSFLIGEGARERERALVMSYFPQNDAAQHLQLYELRDLHMPQGTPAPLSTDWCDDQRVALMYARCAEMDDEITRHLLALLQVDASQVRPADLMAPPDTDKSLLFYAMYEDKPQALLEWERLWSAQPLDTRVALLDGQSARGTHVLVDADDMPDDALLGWCRMAGTLPPDALRAVIAAADCEGDPPLICALRQPKTLLLEQLIGLIDQATAEDPLQAGALLEPLAGNGASALEVVLRHATPTVQETWLKRVRQLPSALAATLMAGLDGQDDPLWARLLAQLDEDALWRLSQCYARHLPEIADHPFALTLPVRSRLRLRLFNKAHQNAERYDRCTAAIVRWLPEATASDLDSLR